LGLQRGALSLPEELRETVARILAYVGGLGLLAIAAASLFQTPAVVASTDPARPLLREWTEVERPYPAFELLLGEIGGNSMRYAILRRDGDDARKDVLTWGEPHASGPYVMVEIYRTGRTRERFIDAASEIAARIIDFTVIDDVKPAGIVASKFGPVPLVDFAIAANGQARRCLGFARAFNDPSLQIAGWYCSASAEVVDRTTVACAIDRLTLVSAGGDERLGQLFARAEMHRSFCGARNPILAATPERREQTTELQKAKLRGFRARRFGSAGPRDRPMTDRSPVSLLIRR
jgi:hypothetical protein